MSVCRDFFDRLLIYRLAYTSAITTRAHARTWASELSVRVMSQARRSDPWELVAMTPSHPRFRHIAPASEHPILRLVPAAIFSEIAGIADDARTQNFWRFSLFCTR
jgi:hypothetical protein